MLVDFLTNQKSIGLQVKNKNIQSPDETSRELEESL
jgi:hypothetical protein